MSDKNILYLESDIMNHNKIKELTLIGLGMAAVFAGTMVMIPNATGGYFNLGDGFIMLFASIVNPLGAFMIGGVASAMVDAVSGYAHYVIPTMIIKGLEGVSISYLMNKYYKSNPRIKYIAYLIGAVIMVTGYFLAKWYMKQSLAIALVTAPENVFQSAVGYVIAILLHPTISSLAEKFRKGK